MGGKWTSLVLKHNTSVTHIHSDNLQMGTGSGFGSGGAIGVLTGLGLSESLIMYVT